MHFGDAPISLTPRFSGVILRRDKTGTALAVSTMLEKPLKRFSSPERFHAPLKQGVNERVAQTFRFSKV